ncbi:MAG: hypothetical protein PHN89_05470 [Candidatus Pacebacteria bacterium]|nr:hypothetical protein [Candidatus Paceibacterota bacterium]MDD5222459.1 hypothetical protein [bacterium]
MKYLAEIEEEKEKESQLIDVYKEGRYKKASYSYLFIDIVSYSFLPNEKAWYVITRLTSTLSYIKRKHKDIVTEFPTGDGVVLCFNNEHTAFNFAVLLLIIVKRSCIRIRVGLHNGPGCIYSDINGKENIAGNAINNTQRIMDTGDENHLLVSKSFHDSIINFEEIRKEYTFTPTEIIDKKNKRIEVYYVYNDDVGNPSKPEKPSPQVEEERAKKYEEELEKHINKVFKENIEARRMFTIPPSR